MYDDKSPEQIVRRLIRSRVKATLATLLGSSSCAEPYASLTLNACDHQARPLIFISNLAVHTKNIRKNPVSSLMFEENDGLTDPLSGPRASVQGVWEEIEDPEVKQRFFRRHEHARRYENAHDFFLFRMNVERAHLVAGFGRIHWINAEKIILAEEAAAELKKQEAGVIEHMNAGHRDALDLYASVYASAGGTGWLMTGVDPEGFDLRREDRLIRIDFEKPIANASEAKTRLIDMLHRARGGAPVSAGSI